MPTEIISGAKRRLLERLKRHGPVTAGKLAAGLGLTDVAVRQHLLALEAGGLVQQQTQPPAGRGRPAVLWSLSGLAQEVFPDRHADLTLDLLESVREAFGEKGLEQLVATRAKRQAEAYRGLLPDGQAPLKKRLEALANQRSAEGYMAEVRRESRGSFLLVEHNCPICEAARCCTGLCAAELDVFRESLGEGVTVERTQHLISGGERCVYRVQKATQPHRE
jgi:predicted ArsR family transcriptional regulator